MAIIENPAARPVELLKAIEIILDRGLGKPVTTSNVNVASVSIQLPAGWATMPTSDRLAWADQLRSRALAGATNLLEDDEGEGGD